MATGKIGLVDDGKAAGTIVIPKSAGRVLRFAAAELRKYVKAMSGAVLPVRRQGASISEEKAAIVLGADPREQTPGADLQDHPFDGFDIHVRDRCVFVRGRNDRSILYGIYALLEELGCCFIEPGVEHVPQRKSVSLTGRTRKEVAAFPLRNLYAAPNHTQKKTPFTALDPKVTLPQIDWMAKRRLNHYDFYVNFYRYDLWEKHKHEVLDALLDRGFDIEVTHHSTHYFCPPDANHDFGDFGPSTYIHKHPDWYLPGSECGARGRWQTRVEKPAVQKIMIKRLLAYMERNPELKIVGLWPDDIPIPAPYKGMSATDGYVKFWNRVGKAVAEAFPDKRLAIIAYFDITPHPKTQKPGPNLHCWYCPIARNLMYPIEHPKNRDFLRWLKGWIRAMPPYRVASFEYYGWQMEFTPLRYTMARDMPFYQEMGLGGIYAWTAFGNHLLGEDCRWALDLFVCANLLWNTRADLRSLEEVWAKGVFRNAATSILDFFDFLRRAHAKEAKRGLAPNYQWIGLDVVHTAQKFLASARQKAETPWIRRRVDLLEKTLCRGATEEIWREGEARLA